MATTVRHFGEYIELGKLVAHYRLMARTASIPQRRELYRELLRSVIRDYREQTRADAERIAA